MIFLEIFKKSYEIRSFTYPTTIVIKKYLFG